MYELKVPVIQNFFVNLGIVKSQNLMQEALEKIGNYQGADFQNPERIILKGDARYGIYIIPIVIELDKAKEGSTLITICGKSSDVAGVGARSCIARLILIFNNLNLENKDQVQEATASTSFIQDKIISEKKLLIAVVSVVILFIGFTQLSAGSFYNSHKLDRNKNIYKENLKTMMSMTTNFFLSF